MKQAMVWVLAVILLGGAVAGTVLVVKRHYQMENEFEDGMQKMQRLR